MPLRKGHVLVIPKEHYENVSDLPAELAGRTGIAVTRVARAVSQALGNSALNIVCNQKYAQAVPHVGSPFDSCSQLLLTDTQVHYHVIPAPTSASAEPIMPIRQMHQMEFEARNELDEEDAENLVTQVKAKL